VVLKIIDRCRALDKPVTLLQLAELWKGVARKGGAEYGLPADVASPSCSKASYARCCCDCSL
jgi:hypothetical protein